MKKLMYMYTSNNCPKCEVAKAQIAHIPEEFKPDMTIRNIDEDFAAKAFMIEDLESMSTPTFYFPETPYQEKAIVRGFEMGQLQEVLGL